MLKPGGGSVMTGRLGDGLVLCGAARTERTLVRATTMEVSLNMVIFC